jgi:hypothetical protein
MRKATRQARGKLGEVFESTIVLTLKGLTFAVILGVLYSLMVLLTLL